MKKKPWDNLNNEIELTSLLDVIFIVLMIVICSQQLSARRQAADAEAVLIEAQQQYEAAGVLRDEAQALADEAQEADGRTQLLEDHIQALVDAEQEIGMITVYLDYQPSDPKNRTVRVYADDQELETLSLVGAGTGQAFASLEKLLEQEIRARSEKPVFITLDKTRILYRDEATMQEILERLTERNQNLYLRTAGGGDGQ